MALGYKPIQDYAVIGNLRTVAVVGLDGSIDWCCMPHLDSPAVFAALLDCDKGGKFSIRAKDSQSSRQYYLPDTNVLVTEFQTASGTLSVTDFMPLAGNIERTNASAGLPEIHRILTVQGKVQVELEWSPRFDYARAKTEIRCYSQGWLASGNGFRLNLAGVDNPEVIQSQYGAVLRQEFEMADQSRAIVSRWDSYETSAELEQSLALLEETSDIWRNWVHGENTTHSEVWTGNYHELVMRSELAMKLLSHAETGAIAAAGTTSLPETLGGIRNWDYRYSWIRDASLAAQAFTSLGHS